MAKIEMLVGSTYGNAEEAALACADVLAAQHTVEVHKQANLTELAAKDFDVLLVCTATIGMGEFPDNLADFYQQLTEASPSWAGKAYGVIALGDSGYDDFANAGILMDERLSELGLVRVGEVCYIDACDSPDAVEPALDWLQSWQPDLEQHLA